MRSLVLLLIGCITALGAPAFGIPTAKQFDYFVDATTGNDANSGKRADLAYATLPALPTITLGMRIGLARNSRFHGQLPFSSSDVTVASYGAGSRAIIDGSTNIPNAAFTLSGGQTYTYQVDVVNNGDSGAWPEVWEDGNILILTNSIANCEGTAGTYYFTGGNGATTYYVHASDSSNVTSNGKVYDHNYWGTPLHSSDQNRCQYVGIEAWRSLNTGAPLYNGGRFCKLIDCSGRGGHVHCVFIGPGGYVKNTSAVDGYRGTNGGSLFVHYGTTDPTGTSVIYDGCFASMPNVNLSQSGFFGHSGAGRWSSVTYTNCSTTNTAGSFSAADNDNYYVLNCRSVGGAAEGVGTLYGTNMVVRDCAFSGAWRMASTSVANSSVLISNVTCVCSGPTSSDIVLYDGAAGGSWTVTDSTFSGGWQYVFATTQSDCTATFLRNTYNYSSYYYYSIWHDPPYNLTSDFNHFQDITGIHWRLAGGAGYLWDDYRTATGQDANSVSP